MQPIINLQDGEGFPLKAGLPAGYRGVILQGARAISGQTPFGLVVFQNFQQADFSVQVGIYKFMHLVRCVLRRPPFQTGSLIALKTNLNSSVTGIGNLTLLEGQYSFLQYNGGNILADFKAGKEYQVLEISCSPEMLSQALTHFPMLAEQFKKATALSSPSLIIPRRYARENVRTLLKELLQARFDPQVTEEYFGYRVREYLLLMLVESSKAEKPLIALSTEEINRIQALAERLKMDPRGKFPIAALAKEMGMSEMRLKLAFQQEIGKPISKFHMDQRMKEAHRLLKDDGLPAKMVAQMVGYSYVTNFISHFGEYFGYPPSTIQKKS
jgi:AraC-like DNA-binding protein